MIKTDNGVVEYDGPVYKLAVDFAVIGRMAVADEFINDVGLPNKSKAFNMLLSGAYTAIVSNSDADAIDIPMGIKAKLIIDHLTDANNTDGVPIPRKGIDY